MKLYSFYSVLDRHIGPRGSEARDDFEREVIEAVESSKMAESLTGSRNNTFGCNNGGSAASTIKGYST